MLRRCFLNKAGTLLLVCSALLSLPFCLNADSEKHTLMGTGLTAFSSSGSGSESGYESDSDKRRIPIDVDLVDGIDDIDEVNVINVSGTI